MPCRLHGHGSAETEQKYFGVKLQQSLLNPAKEGPRVSKKRFGERQVIGSNVTLGHGLQVRHHQLGRALCLPLPPESEISPTLTGMWPNAPRIPVDTAWNRPGLSPKARPSPARASSSPARPDIRLDRAQGSGLGNLRPAEARQARAWLCIRQAESLVLGKLSGAGLSLAECHLLPNRIFSDLLQDQASASAGMTPPTGRVLNQPQTMQEIHLHPLFKQVS
ncbi:hypothetical protein FB45DRAFT_878230 [Roridomyces roridus]|uniref:Uncharacterized protein n=1 Tax=Roridomyces roridus TaxID=1738132 RepID=A0AAD7B1D3_9AGAR|nr:hypothetical protein FB45DRAFT_878230 [Roridomyces roridus]